MEATLAKSSTPRYRSEAFLPLIPLAVTTDWPKILQSWLLSSSKSPIFVAVETFAHTIGRNQ